RIGRPLLPRRRAAAAAVPRRAQGPGAGGEPAEGRALARLAPPPHPGGLGRSAGGAVEVVGAAVLPALRRPVVRRVGPAPLVGVGVGELERKSVKSWCHAAARVRGPYHPHPLPGPHTRYLSYVRSLQEIRASRSIPIPAAFPPQPVPGKQRWRSSRE